MNRLVDHCPAAVFFQLALPTCVVLGRPIPFYVRTTQYEPTESPLLHCVLESTGAITEARLKNGSDPHARTLSCSKDLVRTFGRGIDRLFDHDVLACLNCR